MPLSGRDELHRSEKQRWPSRVTTACPTPSRRLPTEFRYFPKCRGKCRGCGPSTTVGHFQPWAVASKRAEIGGWTKDDGLEERENNTTALS